MMRDFRGLFKIAGIEKSARSLTRLLARVGTDLAGATERDLKYLARRGFKGLKPKQVKALRAKGFLPTVKQELAGFNKGTENMLKWTPDGFEPIGKITRTNSPKANYHTSLSGKTPKSRWERGFAAGGVEIPDVYAPGTLSQLENRASVARHEAREWVRGMAQQSKGRSPQLPGMKDADTISAMFMQPEVGTSHIPGVIRDERVFRSQLANRLGMGRKWDQLPIAYDKNGYPLVRGGRDAYVGSKPLRYEFDRIREWERLSREQTNAARREYLDILASNSDAARLQNEGLSMVSPYFEPNKAMSANDVGLSMIGNAYWPNSALAPDDALRSSYKALAEKLRNSVEPELTKRLGIDEYKLRRLVLGRHATPAAGSELEKVMNLGPFVEKMPPYYYYSDGIRSGISGLADRAKSRLGSFLGRRTAEPRLSAEQFAEGLSSRVRGILDQYVKNPPISRKP